MLVWIHPLVQIVTTLLACYVMYMGLMRFCFAHLGRRSCRFNWKKHVFWGKVVTILWALDLLLGLIVARSLWSMQGATGPHYYVALVMAPLLAFGYLSGYILDKYKKRRAVLPLAHGVNNLVVWLLALYQIYSGSLIIRDYILA